MSNVNYNKNHYAVMANSIIKGKQTMSLQEARLIRLLITQIVKDDINFKIYRINIKDLAKFLEVPDTNLYRDIRNICNKLLTRIVKISTEDPKKPWKSFQWLQLAEYDGNGTITLMLSNQIAPYLLGLNAWFTQYQLKNILAMKSFYSIRLYELLKLTIGENREKNMNYTFTVKYLREYLECECKFKKIIDLKKWVLDIAVRDINEYSEYSCTYQCKKTGKTITDILFLLKKKEDEKLYQEVNLEESKINTDELIDQLQDIIKEPLRIKEYKAILAAAQNNIKLIIAKYNIAKKQGNIDNLVGWLIKAIETDYCEPISKKTQSKNKFNDFPQREYSEEFFKQLEQIKLR